MKKLLAPLIASAVGVLSTTATAANAALNSLCERNKLRHRHQDSLRALSRLSERELADLGLKRIDVEYIAARGVLRV